VSVTIVAPFSGLPENLGSRVREYGNTFAAEFAVMASQIITYRLAHFPGKPGFSEYAVARRAISTIHPVAILGLGVAPLRHTFRDAYEPGKGR
jgi:hypothetical protein